MRQPADLAFEYLQREGYHPDREDGEPIHFKFEGCHMLIFDDENDDEFLHIVMPGIYEFEADKLLSVYDAANETNKLSKGAKVIVQDENVHVEFEGVLSEHSDISTILPRACSMLTNARHNFYSELG